jgi:DNA-binding transcriptional ArsR family regulator
VGTLLAEPARARILLALADGRALPASVLASDAGVARSTASAHLGRLLDGGLLAVLQQGPPLLPPGGTRRRRADRGSGPACAAAAGAFAARGQPRAQALRAARTCYDHLAGRLGVALFAAMIERGWIAGGDGRHDLEHARHDRLAAPGREVGYVLTDNGREGLGALGVPLAAAPHDGVLPLRYCVDWTEQRHHLSGAVGGALGARLFEIGWLRRVPRTRAVRLSDAGREGLHRVLGVEP